MTQHCQHCRELNGLEADPWGEHGEGSCHSSGVNTEGNLVEGVYKTVFGDQLNVGSWTKEIVGYMTDSMS